MLYFVAHSFLIELALKLHTLRVVHAKTHLPVRTDSVKSIKVIIDLMAGLTLLF